MSGFKRLFWALTLLWALFWALLYPLRYQWNGQQQAFDEYNKSNKNCAALLVERPEWDMTQDCYKWSSDNFQTASKIYSLKKFWVLPVALWEVFLPLIVIPPAVVYGLAALGVWIRNGFKPRTRSI